MNQISLIQVKSKIDIAIERIKEFEPIEGYWLGFSGGKDSICCYQLLKMAGVKFESHYNVTGIDHPELIYFIKKHYPDVKFNYPKYENGTTITMWNLIVKELTPPTRISRYCCQKLKENGGVGRFVITGVRWAESTKRKNSRNVIENFHRNKKYQIHSNDNDEGRMMLENCIKKGKFILNPIIDWEDSDVWNFIKGNKFSYPSLYDKGFKRLGCIGCPMSGHQGEELELYPKIKSLYIKAFEKMIIARKNKCKETSWKTGQEVYDWWVGNQKKIQKYENQIKMEDLNNDYC
jgi:phosphoadenosine phosphosulfate reductase